jgi:hypothetical protein
MVTLQLYSAEIYFSRKAAVRLLTSLCSLSVCPLASPHKPLTDLHTIRSHTFEGHLFTFSFNPDPSAITSWRTPTHTRLPGVWKFGVPD